MAVVEHGVSTNTHDRLLIDAGAVYIDFISVDEPGTVLGATEGGNTFEIALTIADPRPDGAMGPIKGFRRITGADIKLTVNLLEMTAENLRRALGIDGYTSGTSTQTDEAVGTGDGSTVSFALDYNPVLENSETVAVVDRGTQVRGTDYTVDYDNGTLYFVTAPENAKAITATYKNISTTAVINGEEITDDSYSTNVALVGNIYGFSPTTKPIIIKLTNALCDAGLSLALADKDETIAQIVFHAHYSAAALSTHPYSITYPSA